MNYKIIDYAGETVNSGFASYTEAFHWITSLFTKHHIKLMQYKIVKEEQ